MFFIQMFARENWFEHYFGFKESLENVMSFIKVEELITKNNIRKRLM